MIYINLPLNVYIYIINISFIILICLGYFLNKKKLSPYFKVITFWLLLLIAINLYNMKLTLANYIKNSKKIGPKGIRGDNGPRGYMGDSDICTKCIPKKEYYGGNRNANNELIENPLLKPGFCKFPLNFNNELVNEPIKSSTNSGGPVNDDGKYGWCATEVNDDLTMKKFGYVFNSEKNINNLQKNKETSLEEKNFVSKNSGIIDLTLISGVRSTIKCPNGYTKLTTDLNSNTDGNYVYLCNKYGVDNIGVIGLKIIDGNSNCKHSYKELKVSLNEGVPKLATIDKLKVCVAKGDVTKQNIIKNIIVTDENKPILHYKNLNINLNKGTNGDPLFFSTTTENTDIILDSAFVWEKDKNLYLFKNDQYWTFTPKNKLLGPFFINNFWGKIIGTNQNSISSLTNNTNATIETTNSPNLDPLITEGIDAIYSDFFDKETYIFKGNLVYAYDPKTENIKNGFPKKINDIWKGLPEDLNFIDSVYADDKNQTIYFIKNKIYYKLNNSNKTFEKGKKIDNLWVNGPKNIIINAMFNFNNNRYIIESDMVYEINDDNTFNSKGAAMFRNVFTTINQTKKD
jgi:energy-coupling factor transporter transmembrane protein EcfT